MITTTTVYDGFTGDTVTVTTRGYEGSARTQTEVKELIAQCTERLMANPSEKIATRMSGDTLVLVNRIKTYCSQKDSFDVIVATPRTLGSIDMTTGCSC